MASDSNSLGDRAEHMRETLVESGHAAAAYAGEVKDQVAATAVVAKDKAEEMAHALAEHIPSTPEEWEAVAKDIMESIRKNPRPWIIGAAVVGFLWLASRRTRY